VALDHSRHSKKTLDRAIELATKLKAELEMMHVVVRNIGPEFEEFYRVERRPFSDYIQLLREQFF
jgi:hypothetical protein